MAEERNVSVKLKFQADTTQSSKAMKDLEQQAQKTGKAVQDANKPAGGSGAGGAGGAGNALMAFAKVAAVVMAFGKAMDAASKAVQIFSDKTSSGAQKYEALANIVTLGLSKFMTDKLDRVMYAKSILAYNQFQQQEPGMMARAQVQGQYSRSVTSLAFDKFAGLDAAELGPQSMSRQIALMKAGRDSEADPRLTNAKVGAEKAFNETILATRQEGRSGMFVKSLQQQLDKMQDERVRMTTTNEKGGNVWRTEMEKSQIRIKDMEILEKQKEIQAAIAMHEKNSMDLAKKRYELRNRDIEISKAELDVLREKEAKAKSFAATMGMASGADKLALKSAIEDANQFGIDTLSEDRRNLIGRFVPDYAGKKAQQSVENDPTVQAIIAATGEKNLQQITKERITLEQKIDVDMQINEEKLAEAMKTKFDEAFKATQKILEGIANTQLGIAFNVRKQIPD